MRNISRKAVPNAPCGVERVVSDVFVGEADTHVPNAPCGVESLSPPNPSQKTTPVPNAPCGVESCPLRWSSKEFLNVPNAPCGVERRFSPPQKGLI